VHDDVHTARVEDVLIDSPEALPLLVVSLQRFAIAFFWYSDIAELNENFRLAREHLGSSFLTTRLHVMRLLDYILGTDPDSQTPRDSPSKTALPSFREF
jgi:hypothetical protein